MLLFFMGSSCRNRSGVETKTAVVLLERPGSFAGRPAMERSEEHHGARKEERARAMSAGGAHRIIAESNKKTLNIYVDRGGMSSILAFEVGVRERLADLKAELVRTFWPSLQFRLVSEHLGPLPDHNTFQECGLADKSMLRLVYTNDSIDISSDEEEEGVAAVQSALRRERSRSPQQRFVVSAAGARGGHKFVRSVSHELTVGDCVTWFLLLRPGPSQRSPAEAMVLHVRVLGGVGGVASSHAISLRIPDTQMRGRNGSTHSVTSLGKEN